MTATNGRADQQSVPAVMVPPGRQTRTVWSCQTIKVKLVSRFAAEMRETPENQRQKILPTHDTHSPGWNEGRPEPEPYVGCADPGHSCALSQFRVHGTVTSQSVCNVSHLLHHPPELLTPATRPWQPTHHRCYYLSQPLLPAQVDTAPSSWKLGKVLDVGDGVPFLSAVCTLLGAPVYLGGQCK